MDNRFDEALEALTVLPASVAALVAGINGDVEDE